MLRKIISIDEEKCNGCGLCAEACHEGAIGMVNGKAKLMRDDYCDGLGDCLPACPQDAIHFVQREAAAYDAEAVKANQAKKAQNAPQEGKLPCGCPGSMAQTLKPTAAPAAAAPAQACDCAGQLVNWPVQLRLVPVNAPYFAGANLLVAADCTAFALGDMHQRLVKGRVVVVGCPKLDADDQAEKLAAILTQNEIKSITVARMEVPCCGGLVHAVQEALRRSGKMIPWQVITISPRGEIVPD